MASDGDSPLPKAGIPQLLVSVRDAAEARAALEGGGDILDVKEPARGSLGMADVAALSSVLDAAGHYDCAGRTVRVSAALGETMDWAGFTPPSLPAGLSYVKLGPAGLGAFGDWRARWRSTRLGFDRGAGSPLAWIAVAYADWSDAGAPRPEAILDAAEGCSGLLLDTWRKDGRTLLDCMGAAEIRRLGARAIERRLIFAVAGSLRVESLEALADVRPDVIAIRSAACAGGSRTAAVDATAVRRFRAELPRAFA